MDVRILVELASTSPAHGRFEQRSPSSTRLPVAALAYSQSFGTRLSLYTVDFAGFRFFHSLSHTALASFAAFRTQPFAHGRFRQQSHFAVFWHTAACNSFCRTRSLLPAFASSAVFRTRSSSATPAFSQSSSTRLLVEVFIAHGRFWQHTLFAVPPHTIAFGSIRSSRTRLLLRSPLQLLPFCSLFQHLLSPSSHSRSPFGSSPCTRPPVASLRPFATFSASTSS